MNKIIADFIKSGGTIDGYGQFKGDRLAAELSTGIPKNQRKKFERYGIVPGAFFFWLKKRGLIKSDAKILAANAFVENSGKRISVRHFSLLPDLLEQLPCPNEKAKQAMAYLIDSIAKDSLVVPCEVGWRYRKPHHRDTYEDKTRRYDT